MRLFITTIALGCCLSACLILQSCFGGSTGFEVGWDYQDMDEDGVRNGLDADIDGDGYLNEHDTYPHDWRYY